jgi:hypothetical protein
VATAHSVATKTSIMAAVSAATKVPSGVEVTAVPVTACGHKKTPVLQHARKQQLDVWHLVVQGNFARRAKIALVLQLAIMDAALKHRSHPHD